VYGLELQCGYSDAGVTEIFVGMGHAKKQSRNACAHPVASRRERH
jgi:hypothetical protein